MKRVYSVKDDSVIEIIRNLLAQEGIETTVLNVSTGSLLGEVPFFSAAPEIWILRDEDEPRARAIVGDYESGAIQDQLTREPWKCPRCGELVEGQFTECWNCTLDGDDDPDPREDSQARCAECGYLLWGLPTRRCPECGTKF
jgi:hypothetical protein